MQLPELPRARSVYVPAVAEFYRLVRGLRLAVDNDLPVPFACGWIAGKLGAHKQAIWRARGALVDAGVLVHAGALPGRDKRGTALYLPGELPGDDHGGVR